MTYPDYDSRQKESGDHAVGHMEPRRVDDQRVNAEKHFNCVRQLTRHAVRGGGWASSES